MVGIFPRPSCFQPSALSPLAAPAPQPSQYATPAPNVFGLAPAVPWSWQQWLSWVNPRHVAISLKEVIWGQCTDVYFMIPPKVVNHHRFITILVGWDILDHTFILSVAAMYVGQSYHVGLYVDAWNSE